ncbi:MAG: MFS transporter, partial [Marinovum algicola]|uniref:MFS transporter n=1 Tax=Marinovum algicola TaxID=42444 RepID=UPI0032EB32FD
PADLRSRVLALRFFGGGVAGLGVAALADRLIRRLDFTTSYAAVFAIAAALMLVSSIVFVAMGEPDRSAPVRAADTFATYLREGIVTYRTDRTFRQFVIAQWCGGAVLMAAPFFVVGTETLGVGLQNVALLLAAQIAGALLSNALWGWWGDRLGKLSLMRAIAAARIAPPLVLVVLLVADAPSGTPLPILLGVFFVLGALTNGLTIAVIGLLMEISPENRRPAYSGYFNALSAPAYLLPLVGGVVAAAFGLTLVFVISAAAAFGQSVILFRIKTRNEKDH